MGLSRSSLLRRFALSTLVLAQLIAFASPAAAEISGNTYTSPQYGFTVTWDDTWFALGEESDANFDFLGLTNGVTFATIVGESNVYSSLEAGVASNISFVSSDPAVSDFEPLRGDSGEVIRGGDESRAFAAFAYTYESEDVAGTERASYIEVRPTDTGDVLVSIITDMPLDQFESERPHVERLLDSLNDPHDPVAGEPGPVFASGPWRIAVATSAIAPEFAELGLDAKTDKEWLLVVLDVTNWSDNDAELTASRFTIALDGEEKPFKIARSSLLPVAEQLALTPFSEDFTLAIDADESSRIVLAFVLPADGQAPRLQHREDAVPIEDTVERTLAPDSMPRPALAPEITEGELVSASDGRTMRIALDGESSADRFQLLGIELQEEGECAEHAAEVVLDDLAGSRVLVEEDAAVSGGQTAVRYVWLIEDDGARTLLNQMLIADGAARLDDIPGDARFGAWLEATAQAAEDAGIGLWGGCDE